MQRCVLRWADDGGVHAALLHERQELCSKVTTDGVADRVNSADLCDGIVVTDVDGGCGSQREGFVELLFAHPGDDLDPGFLRGIERDAADGAEGAGEQDGLACLRAGLL